LTFITRKIELLQRNILIDIHYVMEVDVMNTKTHGTQHGSHVSAGLLSLPVQRETIIKKAQESVRASHQRMRSRCHVRGARV
jgi:hypothetical protein